MKKLIYIFLMTMALTRPCFLSATDSLETWQTETEELWQPSPEDQDESHLAISASMLTWGAVLGAGIAVLAALLGQGDSSPSNTASN